MSEIDVVLVANDPDMGPVRQLNHKSLGPGGRAIPFLEQVDVCWKSLFDNWDYNELPFTAYQLHTEPLGPRMLSVLKPYIEKGLRVEQAEPLDYHPLGTHYNRGVAFVHPTLKSPQRLIIDADIIWLGTPPLNLNAAYAGMWAGQEWADAAICEWGVAHSICDLPYDPQQYRKTDGRPHNLYHLGDDGKDFASMFNMGLTQLHRDLCPQVYPLFAEYTRRIFKSRGGLPYGMKWMAPQYAISLAGRQVTAGDWELLPRGVNFLPVFMDTMEVERAGVEITAYHYAQNLDLLRGLEDGIYGAYFHPAPVYLRPEELIFQEPNLKEFK